MTNLYWVTIVAVGEAPAVRVVEIVRQPMLVIAVDEHQAEQDVMLEASPIEGKELKAIARPF